MASNRMLKVNGVWVPSPDSFSFSTEDMDSEAFRTTNGLTHRQRVAKKIKLTCGWEIVPGSTEYFNFFKLMDNLPEFFEVQFPHPNGTNQFTITAYRGNPLSANLLSYWDEKNQKISKWKSTKVTFIEQ